MMSTTTALISVIFYFVSVANAVRVDLPFGVGVEGVTHIRANNYVLSDLLNGRLIYYDSNTALMTTIVQPEPGRTFQGLAYSRSKNLILAAGSGPVFAGVNNDFLNASGNPFSFNYETVSSAMHVIDFFSGKVVRTCAAPAGSLLVNDVTVDWRGDFAYFTESLGATLYRMNLKALPDCKVTKIALPEASFSGQAFYAAGVAAWRGGILISNFALNNVWYHDVRTDRTYPIITGKPEYGNLVGIAVAYGRCLLAADNIGSKISVFKLTQTSRAVSAQFKRTLSGMDISEPSTIAVNGRVMVATSFNNTILGSEGNIWVTKRILPKASDLC